MSHNRFNGLPSAARIRKPLKRFEHQKATWITRLKPGENEMTWRFPVRGSQGPT